MTPRTIAIIGPMGAGKSSVGRRLAKRLGLPFTDTDSRVAQRHGAIPTLFERDGEAAFRRLEREVVAEALAAGGVVALGGGAVLDPATRADLARATVVLLEVDEASVAPRIGGPGRPLLTDGVASWRRIADERRDVYASLAHHRADTSRRPMEHVVDELAVLLAERPAEPAR